MLFKDRLPKDFVLIDPFPMPEPILLTVLVKGFQVIRAAGKAIGKRLADSSLKKRSIGK